MRVVLAVVALLLLTSSAGQGRQEGQTARAFLARTVGLTGADFARLDRNQVVARAMDVGDRREVATLGVARLRVTPAFYAERLGDVADFKRDEAVLQIGTFGDPPSPRDVADLVLDESDLRSLRTCRVGACGVQLPAGAIDRFRREVAWDSPEAARQANTIMRELLLDQVAGYRQGGAEASLEYADASVAVCTIREFASLVDAQGSRPGVALFPPLRQHVLAYPSAPAADTRDVIYWSKEKVGSRPVVSVTHLAIWRAAGKSPAEFVAASKQIYGSHYFDASLGLTMLVRDETASPSTFVVYLNRSRVDVFTGPFGGIARRIVNAKARAAVSDQLTRLQSRLEAQFAASHGSSHDSPARGHVRH